MWLPLAKDHLKGWLASSMPTEVQSRAHTSMNIAPFLLAMLHVAWGRIRAHRIWERLGGNSIYVAVGTPYPCLVRLFTYRQFRKVSTFLYRTLLFIFIRKPKKIHWFLRVNFGGTMSQFAIEIMGGEVGIALLLLWGSNFNNICELTYSPQTKNP